MNKTKRYIQGALAFAVMIIGIYMWWSYAWPTPPAVSGVGFFLAGLALWTPFCPIMNMLFGGTEKDDEMM